MTPLEMDVTSLHLLSKTGIGGLNPCPGSAWDDILDFRWEMIFAVKGHAENMIL